MLTIDCPQCSKKLKAPETAIGKWVKCECGHLFLAAEPSFQPEPPPFRSPAVRGKGERSNRTVGLYAVVVGLAVVASGGTSALTSILLREPAAQPIPSAPQLAAQDERVPELESRLTELTKRLDDQKQTIERLEKSAASAVATPDKTSLRQVANQANAIKIAANEIDEIEGRLGLALNLQYLSLSQADRADFRSSLDGLDKKTMTWEQYKRASAHLGGPALGPLLLKDIKRIRDCLARDFEAQGDPVAAKIVRGDK
jgi:uncharacterized coiled-coil protein SlyX